MADQSTMWVFQNIYEPTQKDGKWVVYYRNTQTNKWEERQFDIHEESYNFYYKKMKQLTDYYNVFLRELGVRSK